MDSPVVGELALKHLDKPGDLGRQMVPTRINGPNRFVRGPAVRQQFDQAAALQRFGNVDVGKLGDPHAGQRRMQHGTTTVALPAPSGAHGSQAAALD